MERALVTYFDDDYMQAYEILIQSLLYHNPWFKMDLIVYDWGISDENKEICLRYYDNTTFIPVDKSKYLLDDDTLSKHYYAKNFQKFELLKLENYDQILVIDADYVVLRDLGNIFSDHMDGFYVDVNEPTDYESDVPYPDTGLMIIDKRYLNGMFFDRCIEEMKHEFSKSPYHNATSASNEYVFERVFGGMLRSINEKYSPCSIDDRLTDKYIMATPQYKPFMDGEKYNSFRGRLPWNHLDELKKSLMFIKYLMENHLKW